MTKAAVQSSLLSAFERADASTTPYPHWILRDCLPEKTRDEIAALPFEAPELHGVSGTREINNKTRSYFGAEERARFPVCEAVASAMQDPAYVGAVGRRHGVDLSGLFLRIEYALDVDGFWLEPHTDIGAKLFTMLIYLSDGPGHENLGTDIYVDRETHFGRSPFAPGMAMVFIPSDRTFHGFERRPIEGVRRSLIVNYVKPEWRAREQLAYPETPVTMG